MKRYRLSVAYDGTDFCGWGVQPQMRTVQGVMGEACNKIFNEVGDVTAAGRTDSGVHAAGQTVHLDCETSIKAQNMAYRLNAVLPDDVVVESVKIVEDDFHARFHCLAKQYVYRLANGKVPPLFDRSTVAWEQRPLDLHPMREAAKYIEGEHDFKAFMNVGREMESTVRKILRFNVKRRQGQLIFSILGTGFLYNQVRVMVGTMIDIGLGKIPALMIKDILQSRDRKNAGVTVEAKGLSLQKTIYAGDPSEKMLPQ